MAINYIQGDGSPFQFSKDTLWVQITVKEILSLSNNTRNVSSYITPGSTIATYKLIAPNDIQDNINHEWVDYENSIVGRAADLTKTLTGIKKEAGSLGKGALGGDIHQIKAALNTDISGQVMKKVDKPLVYTGTARREYPFAFVFADMGDTYNDVMKVAHEFREYASASMDGDVLGIKFPYICEIKTVCSNPSNDIPIVHIKNAAITNVQAVYQGPYRNGFPSRCELNLQFRDMAPTYRSSYSQGQATVTTHGTE